MLKVVILLCQIESPIYANFVRVSMSKLVRLQILVDISEQCHHGIYSKNYGTHADKLLLRYKMSIL